MDSESNNSAIRKDFVLLISHPHRFVQNRIVVMIDPHLDRLPEYKDAAFLILITGLCEFCESFKAQKDRAIFSHKDNDVLNYYMSFMGKWVESAILLLSAFSKEEMTLIWDERDMMLHAFIDRILKKDRRKIMWVHDNKIQKLTERWEKTAQEMLSWRESQNALNAIIRTLRLRFFLRESLFWELDLALKGALRQGFIKKDIFNYQSFHRSTAGLRYNFGTFTCHEIESSRAGALPRLIDVAACTNAIEALSPIEELTKLINKYRKNPRQYVLQSSANDGALEFNFHQSHPDSRPAS